MSDERKSIKLAEELTEVALERGSAAGLKPHEILRAMGATLVSMTASMAKPGCVAHSLLAMMAAISEDAMTVAVASEQKAATQDAAE